MTTLNYPRIIRFLSTPSARRATFAALILHGADVVFLSTPSARRATAARDKSRPTSPISIHALREEGDYSIPGLIDHH